MLKPAAIYPVIPNCDPGAVTFEKMIQLSLNVCVQQNIDMKKMLIRTMSFRYMNGILSLSALVSLCKAGLRYWFLSNEEKPNMMAFPKMSNEPTIVIEDQFFELSGDITVKLNSDTNIVIAASTVLMIYGIYTTA